MVGKFSPPTLYGKKCPAPLSLCVSNTCVFTWRRPRLILLLERCAFLKKRHTTHIVGAIAELQSDIANLKDDKLQMEAKLDALQNLTSLPAVGLSDCEYLMGMVAQ